MNRRGIESVAYVGTIASADDETTIEDKLHVAGSRGFSSSRGNVLAQIRRRDDHLRFADIVVLQEDDLEQITNVLVLVDNGSNPVDEVDDLLRHPVPWRGLPAKDRHPRLLLLAILWRHGLEGQVAVDDTKDVHLLALVLVDALHLHVKQRRGVDLDVEGVLDVLREAGLVRELDISPLLAELLVVDRELDLVELVEILEELLDTTCGLGGDELGELGVGLVQPAARSDTVGDICELVWAEDSNKVLKDGGLDQVGVKLSHAVDLVGPDDSEVCHADHLGLRLLDDRNPAKDIAIFGEHLLHLLEEEHVNVVDDLQMARQQVLDQTDRPLLQRLRQDGVVGIAKCVRHDVPGLIPVETFEIDQNTLQLHHSERRMSVIELNGDLAGELGPGALGLLEATDNVIERGSNPEVLLLQAELLSTLR